MVRQPFYPWLVVGTVCIGAFIGQVDASIVQLALPELERAFAAPLSAVSWVAIGYVVAFAACLPVFARVAEMAGRKLMYLVGFALFGLASVLCAMAPSLDWLIAFRVLQGIGGAMLGANSIVILVAAAGPARRGRALGIMAAAQAVGVSLGPALGGLLLGAFDWRWVFWVTVPFALAAAVLGWLVVPQTAQHGADRGFDARGALLLMPALTALMLALSKVHAWGPLAPPTLLCVVLAVVLLVAFVRVERRAPTPLVDLRLFDAPGFSFGAIGVVLAYALLYGMFLAMSFALTRGYGEPPLTAGLRMAIIPVALGLVAPFSGGAYERHPRLVMCGGMALCVVALLALRVTLTGSPDSLQAVMAALAVFGAGLGLFIAPNNSATLAVAPAGRSGVAGGLLNLMRMLGTGLGVAAASTLLAWRIHDATGLADGTQGVPAAALLIAVGGVLKMLAAFAGLAGALSFVRYGRQGPARGGA